MRVILDIKDSKAAALLDVLQSLPYVVTKVVTDEHKGTHKAEIIAHIKQSVKEMKLVKAGKLKARPVQALLDEL